MPAKKVPAKKQAKKTPAKKAVAKKAPGKRRSPGQYSPAKTAALKADVLRCLAKGFTTEEAFRRTGLKRSTFYDWRKADLGFDKAVVDAIEAGTDFLEDEVRRRAVEGDLVPIGFYKGEPSAHVVQRSDTLLMFLLKGRRPEKFRENYQVELSGKLELDDMSDKQLKERLAEVLGINAAIKPDAPD